MTILTDALVEKAARATDPSAFDPCHIPDCIHCEGMRKVALDNARSCLTTAVPDLIGVCAKVAMDRAYSLQTTANQMRPPASDADLRLAEMHEEAAGEARSIAADIRALIPPPASTSSPS